MIRVTYLSHSGFLVELEQAYLLFDYYKGELPEVKTEKPFLVFVSHAHYDHYRKDIFRLKEYLPEIYYILSGDVDAPKEAGVLLTGPNETHEVCGFQVRTLRSTDEGVAYLVSGADGTIYHAGDLNWWHWEEEGEVYNTMMRRNYQYEVNKLHGVKIDVAFVPVDPRLGEQYYWGLDCFMRRTDTQAVFPMHFWDNYGIFDRITLEKSAEEYADRIHRITKEGQVFELEVTADGRVVELCR